MNIIIVYGSPHLSGSTSELLKAFLSGLERGLSERVGGVSGSADNALPAASGGLSCAGVSYTYFYTYDMDIRPCTDCGMCSGGDVCRYGDLDSFDGALRMCSGMIIASPVYHSSFPAPLKALMDRTQRYYVAKRKNRPVFRSCARPAAVVLAAGQSAEDGGVIRAQLGHILPPLGMRLTEFVAASGTDRAQVSGSVLSCAERAGNSFSALLPV